MSNIEHLLENAISEVEAGHDIDDFRALTYPINTSDMLERVSATIEEIWQMAVYVVCTHDNAKESESAEPLKPKKAYYEGKLVNYHCPNCGEAQGYKVNKKWQKFCPYCGQAFDWRNI